MQRYPPDDPREWLNRPENEEALTQSTDVVRWVEVNL